MLGIGIGLGIASNLSAPSGAAALDDIGLPASQALLRLRSDAGITLSGSDVSVWTDTVSGKALVQTPTVHTLPAKHVDGWDSGIDTLDFDGVSDALYIASGGLASSNGSYAVLIVVDIGALSAQLASANIWNGTRQTIKAVQALGNRQWTFGNGISTVPSFAGPQCLLFVSTGATSTLYQDGVSVGTVAHTAGNLSGAYILAAGSVSSNTNCFLGNVAEVRVWDGTLTGGDIAAIAAYTLNRYGASAAIPAPASRIVTASAEVLRLRSDKGVESVTGGSQWMDLATGRTGIVLSTPAPPDVIADGWSAGINTLDFDGTEGLRIPASGIAISASGARSVLLVVDQGLLNVSKTYFGTAAGTTFGIASESPSGTAALGLCGYPSGSTASFGDVTSITGKQALLFIYDGTSCKAYRNGVQVGNTITAAWVAISAAAAIGIMCDGTSASFTTGALAEVSFWAADMTASLATIAAYTLARYGV